MMRPKVDKNIEVARSVFLGELHHHPIFCIYKSEDDLDSTLRITSRDLQKTLKEWYGYIANHWSANTRIYPGKRLTILVPWKDGENTPLQVRAISKFEPSLWKEYCYFFEFLGGGNELIRKSHRMVRWKTQNLR